MTPILSTQHGGITGRSFSVLDLIGRLAMVFLTTCSRLSLASRSALTCVARDLGLRVGDIIGCTKRTCLICTVD